MKEEEKEKEKRKKGGKPLSVFDIIFGVTQMWFHGIAHATSTTLI